MDKPELQKTIIKFFTLKKNPLDSDIHKFAEWLKMDADELENEIYEILSSFLYHGLFNEMIRSGKKGKINKEELEMGIKVEHEHTDNDEIAKRIALDHLTEDNKYYTKLKKMEEE